jgi:hypothetical protein
MAGFSNAVCVRPSRRCAWQSQRTEPRAFAIEGPRDGWRRAAYAPAPRSFTNRTLAFTFRRSAVNGAWLFNSYFMQVFAPLALLAAWMLTEGARQSAAHRAAALATAALMAVLLITRNYPARVLEYARADLAALRGHISRQDYEDRYFGGYANSRGYSARANAELADYVRVHTSQDDRIFLFGINGAGVYFLSDRLTAHRFLRVNDFVDSTFPDPDFRLDAVLADLAARRPRYLIFEQLHSASKMGTAADALQDDAAVRRLLAAYRQDATIEDFTLYRLRE